MQYYLLLQYKIAENGKESVSKLLISTILTFCHWLWHRLTVITVNVSYLFYAFCVLTKASVFLFLSGFIRSCVSSSESSETASARPALPVHGDPQLGRSAS